MLVVWGGVDVDEVAVEGEESVCLRVRFFFEFGLLSSFIFANSDTGWKNSRSIEGFGRDQGGLKSQALSRRDDAGDECGDI